MENTSNALIIAGEVLIGVLVLSLAAYMFIQFGTFSSEMHDSMTETQISEFNSNFTVFSDRANITAQEIATAINFAKQANNSKELEWNDNSPYYTTVYIDDENVFHATKPVLGTKFITKKEEYESNEYLQRAINTFIKNNNTKYFSCNVVINKNTENKVVVTPKDNSDIEYNKETTQVCKIVFHSISDTIITIPELLSNEITMEYEYTY